MRKQRIYLSVPHMGGAEQAYIDEAFRTNWLSSVGPNLDGFERDVAQFLGGKVSTLAVSSGTAALHLVLRYLGVGPGDDVAVSTLTFAGSVFPILYLGASPVFIDSEKESGNLDPELLREYLNSAASSGRLPKAVIAVHLYGQHCDLDPIAAVCAEFSVPLVEDAAESLGATYKNRPTATTADFAILSFNGNKIITTTGGGMVVARDPSAIAKIRKWANQSREPSIEYLHTELGYNYRMSNVLAGIGRGQMRVLDARVSSRRAVAENYRQRFADLPGIEIQREVPWGMHSRWLTVAFLNPEEQPLRPSVLVRHLDVLEIELRPVWRPMHTQPMFASARIIGGPVSESLYATGLCLPSSSSLTEDDQTRVVAEMKRLLQNPSNAHNQ